MRLGIAASAGFPHQCIFSPCLCEFPTPSQSFEWTISCTNALFPRHRFPVASSLTQPRDFLIRVEVRAAALKYGLGLNHLPSGRFAAWLAVQVMAHNLTRWTARIGLGEQIATTKTLRRRVFALAGRPTRSARRLTLHLPRRWPWDEKVSRALARLQAIPLPA